MLVASPGCHLFFCQPRVVGQPLPLLSLHLLALPKKSHPFWVTLENCATAALWLKFPPLSFEYTFPWTYTRIQLPGRNFINRFAFESGKRRTSITQVPAMPQAPHVFTAAPSFILGLILIWDTLVTNSSHHSRYNDLLIATQHSCSFLVLIRSPSGIPLPWASNVILEKLIPTPAASVQGLVELTHWPHHWFRGEPMTQAGQSESQHSHLECQGKPLLSPLIQSECGSMKPQLWLAAIPSPGGKLAWG